MKRFLVVTTVAIMVDHFLIPGMKMMQDKGYEVHVACNFEKGNPCSDERIKQIKQKLCDLNIKCFQIDFTRKMSSVKENIIAYKQLSALINKNNYDIVHCHSPIGGALTRFACSKARKNGTKVLYTAHGFHFYKGAPLKNWLIYYPAEKICSYFTDVLITVNKEDYNLAKRKMRAKNVEYIPGVGIELSKFQNIQVDRNNKRKELGVPETAIMLLSVGEVNENKNQEIIIRAIVNKKDIYYVIAGDGKQLEDMKKLAELLGVSERILFLGYRTDVAELCKAADIYALPSKREGLPVAVLEAMASGLPCVVSNIRGNIELIDENGGVLFDPNSLEKCEEAINLILKSDLEKMSGYNTEKIKMFSSETVNEIMLDIYEKEIQI